MNTQQHIPNLISMNDDAKVTSLSRTMINRLRREGKFPPAVSLTEKRIAFVRSEVDTWVKDRIAARKPR